MSLFSLLAVSGLLVVSIRWGHADDAQVSEPRSESIAGRTAASEVEEEAVALGNPEPQVEGEAQAAVSPELPEAAVDTTRSARITWIGGISSTFQELCQPCHEWSASYGEVARRAENGQLQTYLEMEHFISGDPRQEVESWIEAGHPEQ